MRMEARTLRPIEFPKIAEIAREEIYQKLTSEQVETWLKSSGSSPSTLHFVAEESGKIIGFITWAHYDRYGKQTILEISWLAVAKEYQRQRVGEQLIKESFKQLQGRWEELEVVAIVVDVGEENKEARGFYRKVLKPFHETVIPNVWPDGEGIVLFFARPDALLD